MNEDELTQLPLLAWMPSRIPKRKALVTFVPDGPECPEPIKAAIEGHTSRWYPQPGGHRVLIPYEGGHYDSTAFHIDPEAWDHEDCDVCGVRIPPMALCYVTETGSYISLCEPCYQKHVLLRSHQ
jgi:hypothetical protein